MIRLSQLTGGYVYGLRCKGCGRPAQGTGIRNGTWIAFCRRCPAAQRVGGPDHGKILEVARD